jgi:F0F1-type ATP synthase assembly protein I
MNAPPGDDAHGWRKVLGPYLTMGMELAVAIVGMFFIGRWIDGTWDTAPWGMYGGLCIGIVGGFIRFIRRALALGAAEDAEQRRDEKH